MSEIIPDFSKHVSQKQFAEIMRVSHTTVKRWMLRGLPHTRLSRKLVRIDPTEGFRWVKAQGELYQCGRANEQ